MNANRSETRMQLTQTRRQSASLRGLQQRIECAPRRSWSPLPPCPGPQPYTVVHPNLYFPKTTRYSVHGERDTRKVKGGHTLAASVIIDSPASIAVGGS